MRIPLLLISVFVCSALNAQSVVSPQFGNYLQQQVLTGQNSSDSLSTPKWLLTSYKGLSTGITVFRGGHASFVSAPMGLQLNRRLNDNLYAFANVSVSPSFVSFNSSFLSTGMPKPNIYNFNQNNFGIYPAASVGLMYINDAKTFSISGSITTERYSYPMPPYYPVNETHKNPVIR